MNTANLYADREGRKCSKPHETWLEFFLIKFNCLLFTFFTVSYLNFYPLFVCFDKLSKLRDDTRTRQHTRQGSKKFAQKWPHLCNKLRCPLNAICCLIYKQGFPDVNRGIKESPIIGRLCVLACNETNWYLVPWLKLILNQIHVYWGTRYNLIRFFFAGEASRALALSLSFTAENINNLPLALRTCEKNWAQLVGKSTSARIFHGWTRSNSSEQFIPPPKSNAFWRWLFYF